MMFTSHDARYELPDPRYIKMHAVCARVAHMSGAGAYVNEIIDDLDKGQIQVLSENGSSGRLLDFALLASKGMRITAH